MRRKEANTQVGDSIVGHVLHGDIVDRDAVAGIIGSRVVVEFYCRWRVIRLDSHVSDRAVDASLGRRNAGVSISVSRMYPPALLDTLAGVTLHDRRPRRIVGLGVGATLCAPGVAGFMLVTGAQQFGGPFREMLKRCPRVSRIPEMSDWFDLDTLAVGCRCAWPARWDPVNPY